MIKKNTLTLSPSAFSLLLHSPTFYTIFLKTKRGQPKKARKRDIHYSLAMRMLWSSTTTTTRSKWVALCLLLLAQASTSLLEDGTISLCFFLAPLVFDFSHFVSYVLALFFYLGFLWWVFVFMFWDLTC